MFKKAGLDSSLVPLPEWILVGTWTQSDPKALRPLPVKVTYKGGDAGLAKVCNVTGLTLEEYSHKILAPVGPGIWVANGDFAATPTETWDGAWAQDSLVLAERVLHKLAIPKPSWLNGTYYQSQIIDFGMDFAGDHSLLV